MPPHGFHAVKGGRLYEGSLQKIKTLTGEPIVGVTVQQKGFSLETITDVDGKFSINMEGNKGILEISYKGIINQEADL